MKVILLKSVAKLGVMGDIVEVAAGFGRNFLLPQEKALPATAANLKEFEARRADFEKAAAESLKNAEQRSAKLDGMEVVIPVKAGSEGKLYGAVTTQDIAQAITAAGVDVNKREVVLTGGGLRTLGQHTVKLHLHAGVEVDVKVELKAG